MALLSKEFFDVLSTQIVEYIHEGELIVRDKITSYGARVLMSRIASHDMDKGVIIIKKFPARYSRNLSEDLNELIKNSFSDAKVNVVVDSGLEMDGIDKTFKSRMEYATRYREDLESVFNSMSKTEKLFGRVRESIKYKQVINKKLLDHAILMDESYQYMYDQYTTGRPMSHVIVTVEFSVRSNIEITKADGTKERKQTGKQFKRVQSAIEGYLGRNGFEYDNIIGSLPKYLRDMSIAGTHTITKKTGHPYELNLLSEENYTNVLPNSINGATGDGTGISFGVDVDELRPATINFKRSGGGQGLAVIAESGWGKTFLIFDINDSVLISGDHVSVIDVKGDEHTKYVDEMGIGVVIDVGSPNARVPNLFDISGLNLDKELGRKFYDHASEGVLSMVKLLCQVGEVTGPNATDRDKLTNMIIERMASQAIDKTYMQHRVFRDNPRSFKNCNKGMYKTFLDTMRTLSKSSSYIGINKKYASDIILSIENFFSCSRQFTGMLDNPLTIAEILDEPLVVYTLNKNSNSNPTLTEAIRYFFIPFYDKFKQMYRKSQGKYTWFEVEEAQRFSEFKELLRFIAGIFTGARSANVVPVILGNSLALFDKRTAIPELAQIATQIKHMAIGCIGKMDLPILEESFNADNILHLVEKLSLFSRYNDNGEETVSQTSKDMKKYRNAFALTYDEAGVRKRAMVKSMIPEELIGARETRTIEKDFDYKEKVYG